MLDAKTVKHFYHSGLVRCPGDIFRAHRHASVLLVHAGWTPARAQILLDQIDACRVQPLSALILALGTPGMTVVAAQWQADAFQTYTRWYVELTALAAFGGPMQARLESQIGAPAVFGLLNFFLTPTDVQALDLLAKEINIT